jgi:hypothetical protein
MRPWLGMRCKRTGSVEGESSTVESRRLTFTARELPVNSPGSRVLAPRAAEVFREDYRAPWWRTMLGGLGKMWAIGKGHVSLANVPKA